MQQYSKLPAWRAWQSSHERGLTARYRYAVLASNYVDSADIPAVMSIDHLRSSLQAISCRRCIFSQRRLLAEATRLFQAQRILAAVDEALQRLESLLSFAFLHRPKTSPLMKERPLLLTRIYPNRRWRLWLPSHARVTLTQRHKPATIGQLNCIAHAGAIDGLHTVCERGILNRRQMMNAHGSI